MQNTKYNLIYNVFNSKLIKMFDIRPESTRYIGKKLQILPRYGLHRMPPLWESNSKNNNNLNKIMEL